MSRMSRPYDRLSDAERARLARGVKAAIARLAKKARSDRAGGGVDRADYHAEKADEYTKKARYHTERARKYTKKARYHAARAARARKGR